MFSVRSAAAAESLTFQSRRIQGSHVVACNGPQVFRGSCLGHEAEQSGLEAMRRDIPPRERLVPRSTLPQNLPKPKGAQRGIKRQAIETAEAQRSRHHRSATRCNQPELLPPPQPGLRPTALGQTWSDAGHRQQPMAGKGPSVGGFMMIQLRI